MKIKEGFILKEINGVNSIIAVGSATKLLNGMIVINDTSAFIWKLIKENLLKEQIIDRLVEEYDVSKEKASLDLQKFIDKLIELKVLEN